MSHIATLMLSNLTSSNICSKHMLSLDNTDLLCPTYLFAAATSEATLPMIKKVSKEGSFNCEKIVQTKALVRMDSLKKKQKYWKMDQILLPRTKNQFKLWRKKSLPRHLKFYGSWHMSHSDTWLLEYADTPTTPSRHKLFEHLICNMLISGCVK